MVENTGTPLYTNASAEALSGTVRPVNMPEPVRVEEDKSGMPSAVRLKRRVRVTAIDDKWRIDDEWWRAEVISRLYYSVLLNSGDRWVLYKDLIKGDWYKQEY